MLTPTTGPCSLSTLAHCIQLSPRTRSHHFLWKITPQEPSDCRIVHWSETYRYRIKKSSSKRGKHLSQLTTLLSDLFAQVVYWSICSANRLGKYIDIKNAQGYFKNSKLYTSYWKRHQTTQRWISANQCTTSTCDNYQYKQPHRCLRIPGFTEEKKTSSTHTFSLPHRTGLPVIFSRPKFKGTSAIALREKGHTGRREAKSRSRQEATLAIDNCKTLTSFINTQQRKTLCRGITFFYKMQ